MTASELLTALRSEGARVWIEDGQPRLRAPRGVLTDQRRTLLAEVRGEIIALLTSYPCTGCGRFAFPNPDVLCFHCRRAA